MHKSVNIPEPVQYHIYALAFPFDLRCESVTSVDIRIIYIYTHTQVGMNKPIHNVATYVYQIILERLGILLEYIYEWYQNVLHAQPCSVT